MEETFDTTFSDEAQVTEQLHNLSSTTLSFEQNRLRNQRDLLNIEYQIDRLTRLLPRRREILESGGVSEEEVEDLEAELRYYRGLEIALLEAQAVDEEFQTTQIVRLDEALEAMNENLGIARENLQNLTVHACKLLLAATPDNHWEQYDSKTVLDAYVAGDGHAAPTSDIILFSTFNLLATEESETIPQTWPAV